MPDEYHRRVHAGKYGLKVKQGDEYSQSMIESNEGRIRMQEDTVEMSKRMPVVSEDDAPLKNKYKTVKF